jgi:hypothetical protein
VLFIIPPQEFGGGAACQFRRVFIRVASGSLDLSLPAASRAIFFRSHPHKRELRVGTIIARKNFSSALPCPCLSAKRADKIACIQRGFYERHDIDFNSDSGQDGRETRCSGNGAQTLHDEVTEWVGSWGKTEEKGIPKGA